MILVEAYYFLVLLWLGYMAYKDYHTREVSNQIIGVFCFLSLSALTMNYNNLTIYHGVIVVAVIALYLARLGMGGADMKALGILILTLNEGMMYLFIYFTLISAAALVVEKIAYKDSRQIPGMVAICAGYAVVFMVGLIF